MIRPGWQSALLHLLFFLSGSAGLGYQMVWSKMFALGLGHEMPSVLAVVFACLAGMGAGAVVMDRVVSRSRRPGLWYGGLEVAIALWGFLTAWLIPSLSQRALPLIGLEPSALRHWGVAFALPFLTLLPATLAMGATFPAMERIVSSFAADRRCVGGLYASNTLGAVGGTLLGAFMIVPALGFRKSLWLLAAVNLVCGIVVLGLKSLTRPLSAQASPSPALRAPSPPLGERDGVRGNDPPQASRLRLGTTLFLTGLLGLGYEVVGVRVMSQVLENTVYTFASVLSIYLLGPALGAACYQRFGRGRDFSILLTDLLCGLSLSVALGLFVLSRAQFIYDACRAALGDRTLAVMAAEMALAATVFALPTMVMGALFSHLVQSARRQDGGVGRAMAMNTFGGALATVWFGVIMLPFLGSRWTLVLIALGYLTLAPKVAGWRWGVLAAPVALLFVLPADLRLVRLPPGATVTDYREGIMASVAVIEDATQQRTLHVNNRFQQGGTAAAALQYRHAHIPLLLHTAPRRALFLGLGTGITFGAAGLHPNLESDGVELVPEVIEVMPRFEPHNFAPGRQPQLTLHTADARRFVRVTEARYDVIVADLFHPAMDGAGALYTREHFEAIRGRLTPGGLFCQWLPLHQLDEPMLRVITRTFLEVFPEAQAWLLSWNADAPALGLIGSLDPRRYSSQWVEGRLSDPRLEAELKKLALADSIRLFGSFVAGPKALREFAAEAPLSTDDRPRVLFGAPQFVYQQNSRPYGRLLTVLQLGAAPADEGLNLGPGPDAAPFAARLAKFVSARDVYLKGLIEDIEGRRAQAIDAFVESARLSGDFTAGYAQCLSLASWQAKSRPDEARALLRRLIEAQPSLPIAKEMLERLSKDPGQ